MTCQARSQPGSRCSYGGAEQVHFQRVCVQLNKLVFNHVFKIELDIDGKKVGTIIQTSNSTL